jgi:hypothetical protein
MPSCSCSPRHTSRSSQPELEPGISAHLHLHHLHTPAPPSWFSRHETPTNVSITCAPVVEVEVAKAADTRVKSCFMDPAGNHVLVNLRTGGQVETHYLHRK